MSSSPRSSYNSDGHFFSSLRMSRANSIWLFWMVSPLFGSLIRCIEKSSKSMRLSDNFGALVVLLKPFRKPLCVSSSCVCFFSSSRLMIASLPTNESFLGFMTSPRPLPIDAVVSWNRGLRKYDSLATVVLLPFASLVILTFPSVINFKESSSSIPFCAKLLVELYRSFNNRADTVNACWRNLPTFCSFSRPILTRSAFLSSI